MTFHELLSISGYDGFMTIPRTAARRRVLKAGSILFGGSAIDCTVRNLSESGAALNVVSPLFIPDRFTLAVPTDELKRPCRIIWRKPGQIGVTFK